MLDFGPQAPLKSRSCTIQYICQHDTDRGTDECSLGIHDCEQECFNTMVGFSYACGLGYLLRDRRFCVGMYAYPIKCIKSFSLRYSYI